LRYESLLLLVTRILLIFRSVFFFVLPRRPRSTLFPYTTLFRSRRIPRPLALHRERHLLHRAGTRAHLRLSGRRPHRAVGSRRVRSEEHTSELQSLRHLVCRLLLEKKKKNMRSPYSSFIFRVTSF